MTFSPGSSVKTHGPRRPLEVAFPSGPSTEECIILAVLLPFGPVSTFGALQKSRSIGTEARAEGHSVVLNADLTSP